MDFRSAQHDSKQEKEVLKQYGNTELGGSASAHLGDVNNVVNINGGIYVHVQTPLHALTTTACAVRALSVAQDLQHLSKRYLQNALTLEEARKLPSLRDDLFRLNASLSDIHSTDEADRSLHALVSYMTLESASL